MELGQKHISCPKKHIFLYFKYDWNFMLSLFKFLQENNESYINLKDKRNNLYKMVDRILYPIYLHINYFFF